jgi:hypothetical protein
VTIPKGYQQQYLPQHVTIRRTPQNHLLAASDLLLTQKALPKEASKYPALFLKAWKKRATELAEDTEGDFVEFGE